MDRSEFAAQQAQHLVAISSGVAFIPPPLPPELDLPRQMLLLDGDARGAVGELVGESRRVQASLLLAPLRRREAVLSNVIEGTYTQVEDVLLGEALDSGRDLTPETTEVLRTVEAIEIGQKALSDGQPLGIALILELHAALLRFARGERRNPGQFRERQVFLGTLGGRIEDARFVPAPYEQVRPLMDGLVAFIAGSSAYGPLIDAALVHYQFETIHPFEDGNGRLGRVLIPLFLMHRKVMDTPTLYLGGFFAAHREEYIGLLGNVSKRGDWLAWIEFFLNGVLREAREADGRLRRVVDLMDRYRTLAGRASRSAVPLNVLDFVVEHVYVSVGDIAGAANVSVPTARAAIGTLEEVGILKLGPRVRGKQYWVAQEVIDELYQL